MAKPVYHLNNGTNGVEENRLMYQHSIIVQMTKTLLPSEIQQHLSSLPQAPAIADVGTGTGIWLSSLAAELPRDARLDGYDVETTKFLPPDQLPSNVTLLSGNILEPFPESMRGQYDLVHVRLLIFAIKADEWVAAAANARSLLKPGGYLLWEDTGYPSMSCLPFSECFRKWLELEFHFCVSAGRDPTCPMKLARQVEEAGFTDCVHYEFSSYSESEALQAMVSNLLVNVARQSSHGMVDRGGFGWAQSHQVVDEHFDELQSEVETGKSTLGFVMTRVVGRSPTV